MTMGETEDEIVANLARVLAQSSFNEVDGSTPEELQTLHSSLREFEPAPTPTSPAADSPRVQLRSGPTPYEVWRSKHARRGADVVDSGTSE